ncbi:MAG TPA: DUF5009 domain-containing protein [Silvibacterium sp.]|nr:DUF5009 domain-containing protein [Silvibacterium sp.]
MSAASTISTQTASPATSARRIASIDIFRGLTMVVMIFVNDLGEVHGLPWWTDHAHRDQDLMTYVDMVFPFFLFIVGMSMPLAIGRRLQLNASPAALWVHIAMRSCALIILGLILANAEKADPARMNMSRGAWELLGLAGRHPLLARAPSRYAPSRPLSCPAHRRPASAHIRLRYLPPY